MLDDSAQLVLLGANPTKLDPEVELQLAKGCRDRHHAFVKCYEVSNLAPKEVYTRLGKKGITQAAFSKLISGSAHPDPNLYEDWMAVCGNLIPLRYDVWRADHEMKPIQSSLEAELEKRTKELDEQRRLNRLLVEVIRNK